MSYRNLVFANSEIYHVFNRGIARAPVFRLSSDYGRFLDLLGYYRFNPRLSFSHCKRLEKSVREQFLKELEKNAPVVEILAFCLMTNHFHLLLRQSQDQGIKRFTSNIQNGYAKYFNTKHDRSGSLFQVRFKAVRVETDEQFLHISRYIHLNPCTSYLVEPENLLTYQWCSLSDYTGRTNFPFLKPRAILELIGGEEKYREFVFNQVEYQRVLGKIRHLCLE